jgi:hypothetical protein
MEKYKCEDIRCKKNATYIAHPKHDCASKTPVYMCQVHSDEWNTMIAKGVNGFWDIPIPLLAIKGDK